MKRLRCLGDSLTCMREFPEDARHDAVYVLHAYQKKTQSTPKRDIELANNRFTELMRGAQ